jgi:hypothetical protein
MYENHNATQLSEEVGKLHAIEKKFVNLIVELKALDAHVEPDLSDVAAGLDDFMADEVSPLVSKAEAAENDLDHRAEVEHQMQERREIYP